MTYALVYNFSSFRSEWSRNLETRQNQAFDNVLNKNELIAWRSIKEVIDRLLGKYRSENYQSSIHSMMNACSKIRVNMSL